MTDVQFYQAEFTGAGNHVGGMVTSTVVGNILSDPVVAPPHGSGMSWTYDKYFVNVLDGGTVNSVEVYLVAGDHPEQMLFATTPYFDDYLSGSRIVHGDQSNIEFYNHGVAVSRPDFVHAHGLPNALMLYNRSGDFGGQTKAQAGTGNSLALWVARKLDEHIVSGHSHFSIEVSYDT